MGCVSSKNAKCLSPPASRNASSLPPSRAGRSTGPHHLSPLDEIEEKLDGEAEVQVEEIGKLGHNSGNDLGDNLETVNNDEPEKKEVVGVQFGRMAEGEQVAAGWPPWLAAVAGEAIDGWLPLKFNSFERLEKIGQGTYSNVYRARDLQTGKMVAVKKVRFDNFQPESVRFMAREIVILRKLDHPNIMKLEGIIASLLSRSLYLVFEYMEHDLAGLLSSPDVKFTSPQIKCLMKQLLTGLEHCHSRGIMHRDIKTSNILVNDEGILKLADFGLANFVKPNNMEVLTSRVVTLWYRPPELLLGSTNYGEAVDLWSVGCVLGELYTGRPLIKGKTEVEQLHKIFRLCGSPPEDYWKRLRLPLAPMFKPQRPYESMLYERCKELPIPAVNLMEMFLSVEPYKRGTAAAALNSEYFNTTPHPCEPSGLPKCAPSKEIDAKIHEDIKRKNGNVTAKARAGSRNHPRRVTKTLQESNGPCRTNPTVVDANGQVDRRTNHSGSINAHRRPLKQPRDTKSDISHTSVHSAPTQVTPLSHSASEKQSDVFTRLHSQPIARCRKPNADDPASILQRSESDGQENKDPSGRIRHAKPALLRKQVLLLHHDSFDSAEVFVPQEQPTDSGCKKRGRRIFSGPLKYQNQEQPQHRTRFYKD